MKEGEFWIVEFRGEVTIAQPIAGGARWQFVGDMKGYEPNETFRVIRKLDLATLIDRQDKTDRRLLWLLIEAAGGTISISHRALQSFDVQRAIIEKDEERSDGCIIFRSKLKEAS